jgi:signal transduction histidine kinase
MEMAELNGGCTPCALKLNNGYFSFPTMDGLVWVNPETVDPILPIGEIFIDEINVDNKIITVDSFSKIPLKSGIKDVSFQIGFSSWGNIENMNLEYQLNDAAIWKPFNINQEAKLTFSNLPHGNYELKIRKANGFGLNNFASKAIRFTIEKPWYMENWFILLALIVFSILIILTINLRTHQLTQQQHKLESQVKDKTKELQENNDVLEKSNLLKTRLISIISHDIITPLKFVHIAGKNLLEKQHIISPTLQQETIQEITNTSGELHLLSTNILNWIKYQHEDRRLEKEQFYPNAVVSQLFNILQSIAEQKQLILENTIDKDIRLFQMIEPFKIVVYNLILNAINFTAKGNITISAKVANQRLNITVEDKGIGMTKEQIHNIMSDQFIVSSANVNNRKGNGLGYLIVKDLIKIMNAELQITSEKYKGTTITVSIPGINE